MTCARGGQASIAAGVLSITAENVRVIDGSIVGWKEAGFKADDAWPINYSSNGRCRDRRTSPLRQA